MSDGWTVALALATALGAFSARPVPRLIALAVVTVALLARRPYLLCLGAWLLAASLSAAAWAGVRPPKPAPFDRVVTLRTDPGDAGGALRAVAKAGHRYIEISARGPVAAALAPRLAGERLHVVGRLGALSPSVRDRLARVHVAAEVAARDVQFVDAGSAPARATNGLRRELVRGARSLPPDRRALFTGFVLGDDRGEPAEVVEDFRASGLSHLLVVSGENVAFVLALATPLLRRMRLTARWALGLAVLAAFGVLTRWEPSVMRALAMAAISLTAAAIGRPASSIRILALAVTAVLLIDPMLVGSVGFLLSVGASTGIVLLARPLAVRLPGPRPLAAAAAVTMAAQVGVAPVLIPVFGPMPLVTLPANLLAIPAAGPLVMWGLLAGVVAGVMPAAAAATLHLPTRVLVWWIATVARVAAAAPLGRLGAVAFLAVAGLVAVGLMSRRPAFRRALLAAAVATALVPSAAAAAGLHRTAPLVADGVSIAPGARLWAEGSHAVLVLDVPSAGPVIRALRSREIGHLDVVVARSTAHTASASVAAILSRVRADHLAGGVDDDVAAGPFTVEIRRRDGHTTVDVRRRAFPAP